MGARLLGIETEYAFSALDPKGRSLPRGPVLEMLLRLAAAKLQSLRGAHSPGLFLANGSRFYIDAGHHPELSTPECVSPWEVVRYALAGDRILTELAEELVSTRAEIGEIILTRCNVDYGGAGTTWGCHESYLYRGDSEIMAREIIPHFVSRIIYSGAGGFDSLSSGLSFTLSPRVSHLHTDRSPSSTDERGIYHDKDESLCGGGFQRLHVLCGESSCSRTTAILKLGTTALVVALVEAGLRPSAGAQPGFALRAMQRFAADPDCRAQVPSRQGPPLTAIGMQRQYLLRAEAHLGDAFMPPWAEEVCHLWRSTLDELERDPTALATRLDWPIKLALFRRHASRRGLPWESVPRWTRVADQLSQAIAESGYAGGSISAEEILSKESPVQDAVQRLTPEVERDGLRWDGLRPFLDLKKELFEIDTRFSQLGDRGIFYALDRVGALDHDLPGIGDVGRAMAAPPASGRARLRGEAVRDLSARRQTCSAEWEGVWDRDEKRTLDLRDPFAETPSWKSWADAPEWRLPLSPWP